MRHKNYRYICCHLVVAKLRKLIEQKLLEYVPSRGSKWASPNEKVWYKKKKKQ